MKHVVAAFLFLAVVLASPWVFAGDQGYGLQWQNETGGWTRSTSITADGSLIAAGSTDTYVHLFDQSGERLWQAKTSSYINSVSISDDGRYLAAASDDTNIYLFDENGSALWSYDIGRKGVSLVSISGNGAYLAAASDHPDDMVYFFNRNMTMLWRYKLADTVTALSISNDGGRIVTGSLDTNLYSFDRDGKILWTFGIGNVAPLGVAVSDDGHWVAAGQGYFNLTLINDEGVVNWSVETAGRVKQVFFTNKDSEIAVFTDTGVLEFYSINGTALFNRSVANRINTLALSADGSKIAAGFDKPNAGIYYYRLNLSQSNNTLPVTPKITILANSIDLDLAADFIAFLRNGGVEVESTSASNFEGYKNREFIIILGGPDAPEGVGGIVQNVLTGEEADTIREPGAKKMYVKPDVWAAGQKIVVLAGADRNLTAETHLENRDFLIGEIGSE